MSRLNTLSKISLKFKDIEIPLVLFLSSLFVFVNTISDFLFFRNLDLHIPILNLNINPVAAAFTWPLTYIISDVIMLFYGRMYSVAVITWGTLVCDGFFGIILKLAAGVLPRSVNSSNDALSVIITLGNPIWILVYTGIITTIFTSIIELFLFAFVYNKSNKFVFSALISILITISIRTFTGDYFTLRDSPNVFNILINNLFINLGILLFYLLLIKLTIKLIEIYYSKQNVEL